MVWSSSFLLAMVLSNFYSGTRKLKKISPTAKSAVAKQASEAIDLERSCRFVFTTIIVLQNVWQNSKRTGKDIENVDNRERRINAGENVSGLSRKT